MPDTPSAREIRDKDKKEKKKHQTLKSLTIFIGAFIICLSVLIVSRVLLTVQRIEIQGIDKLYAISSLYGRYLPLLDEEEIEEALIKANPTVETLTLTKKLPDTLVVVAKKRAAIAALEVDGGFFILSKDAVLLLKDRQPIEKTNLPKILYYQKFNLTEYAAGESIEIKDIAVGLFFIEKIENMGILVDRLDIVSPRMLLLVSKNGKKYLFTTEKDEEIQVEQVSLLLKKMITEKRDYNGIDVRYNKPVLQLK